MPGGETNEFPEQVSLCPDEICLWCHRFGCKEEMLKSAVSRVGSSSSRVESEIQLVKTLVKAIGVGADALQAVAERISEFSVDEDMDPLAHGAAALIAMAKNIEDDYGAVEDVLRRYEGTVRMLERAREGLAQDDSAQGKSRGGR